jgi:hypothetical protein
MTPYQLILTLNPATVACLTLGDFDGEFVNREINEQVATVFNRYFVCQFAKFGYVRHLITRREGLVGDMTWAPFDLVKDENRKVIFRQTTS